MTGGNYRFCVSFSYSFVSRVSFEWPASGHLIVFRQLQLPCGAFTITIVHTISSDTITSRRRNGIVYDEFQLQFLPTLRLTHVYM